MRISEQGLRDIAAWEGFSDHLYNDPAPNGGNCTIGFGDLVHLGPCNGAPSEAPYANGITFEAAVALLRAKVQEYGDWVEAHTRPLAQHEYDALTDLCYNIGMGGYYRSPVREAANRHAGPAEMLGAFMQHVYANGQVLPGLVRRRREEWETYFDTSPIEPPPDDPQPEEDVVKILSYFTDRAFADGRWEINLFADCGRAKSYLLRAQMAPDSTGTVTFKHGDERIAATIIREGSREFLVLPGQYGTAPFNVSGGGIRFGSISLVALDP